VGKARGASRSFAKTPNKIVRVDRLGEYQGVILRHPYIYMSDFRRSCLKRISILPATNAEVSFLKLLKRLMREIHKIAIVPKTTEKAEAAKAA